MVYMEPYETPGKTKFWSLKIRVSAVRIRPIPQESLASNARKAFLLYNTSVRKALRETVVVSFPSP